MQMYKSDTIRFFHGIQPIRSGLNILDRLSPTIVDNVLLNLFLRVRQKPVHYANVLPRDAQPITIYHNLRKLVGFEWHNDGPTVLLVHGWESNLAQLLAFVDPLRRNGFRVLAFDAPGHGLSPRQPSHLMEMADAVQDVAEQHGPIHGIIAHSMGAAAAVMAVSWNAALNIKRMALIAPMPDLDTQLHQFSESAALSGAMRARLRTRVASYIGMSIDACCAATAAKSIKTNALIVHDCFDKIIPVTAGYEIARALKASFVTTEGLGHDGVVTDHMTVRRVADYMC